MGKERIHINLVIIGHVDSGKSTTTGHLVYKCGGIDHRTIEKYEKAATQWFKGWKLKRKEGHSNGRTLLEVLDSLLPPVRNASKPLRLPLQDVYKIGGVGTVPVGKIETGVLKPGMVLTFSPAKLTAEVKSIEMHHQGLQTALPEFSSNTPVCNYQVLLKMFVGGFSCLIRIGAELCRKMQWFKGWKLKRKEGHSNGRTLLEVLDSLLPPVRNASKPLRLPLQDVYKIGGVGTVPVGKIETGVLKPGMVLTFSPAKLTAEVKSIEMHHQGLQTALPGHNVGFNIKNVSVKNLRRGDVAGNAQQDPPSDVSSFIAQIIMLNHPGKIKVGYSPVLDCHTTHVSCRFAELREKLDRRSGKKLEDWPQYLMSGDGATIKLVPNKPLCVESFFHYPPLGRFAVRDLKQTVAVGVIKSVEKVDQVKKISQKPAVSK
ncbi:elongation factor 1-alpha, oocyte form-like [Sinocyclocheilus grahami]|uniref:elongation factor 1-alpha, oocyte form-like n=2 Tax=Sinocyclocheilus TaxID=75365 RepID=UPI0007AD5E4C|nr:PREDICTED: elongation factor 1-alpha, oocyte form-like [Sinocyclocheilus grahami]